MLSSVFPSKAEFSAVAHDCIAQSLITHVKRDNFCYTCQDLLSFGWISQNQVVMKQTDLSDRAGDVVQSDKSSASMLFLVFARFKV